jgi:hypothetical protein
MELTAAKAVAWERIPAGRLLRDGVLAAVFSAIANELVLAVAIAAVGLLLSFLPIALAGVTGSSAGTLALLHELAAATNVGLLTRLGRKE